jgi:hypothetical protein
MDYLQFLLLPPGVCVKREQKPVSVLYRGPWGTY